METILGAVIGAIIGYLAAYLQIKAIKATIEQTAHNKFLDTIAKHHIFDKESGETGYVGSWVCQQEESISYSVFESFNPKKQMALMDMLMDHDIVAATIRHGQLPRKQVIDFQGDMIWKVWFVLKDVVYGLRRSGKWSPVFCNYLERLVEDENFREELTEFWAKHSQHIQDADPARLPAGWIEGVSKPQPQLSHDPARQLTNLSERK